MTQYELVSKIESFRIVPFDPLIDALRAVVELHRPELMVIQSMCLACTNNLETVIYPCPTIQAIEKELK